MRKAAAQAGKTGWVYILDRITGEPLLGIEERPVLQEPRQKTSPTQLYPIGDAFSPQEITEKIEGGTLVNQGRFLLPSERREFWPSPAPLEAPIGSPAPMTLPPTICTSAQTTGLRFLTVAKRMRFHPLRVTPTSVDMLDAVRCSLNCVESSRLWI